MSGVRRGGVPVRRRAVPCMTAESYAVRRPVLGCRDRDQEIQAWLHCRALADSAAGWGRPRLARGEVHVESI